MQEKVQGDLLSLAMGVFLYTGEGQKSNVSREAASHQVCGSAVAVAVSV